MATVRGNGFDSPLSLDQKTSFIVHPIVTAAFYAICGVCLPSIKALIVLLAFSVVVVTFLACWYYCETVDPSDGEKAFMSFFPTPHKTSRYCGVCKKTVPGLDHHCTWLNTCIGFNNYPEFYTLITLGTIQFSAQTIIGVLLLTTWYSEASTGHSLVANAPYLVIVLIHNIAACALAFVHGSLCGFHTYLLYIRCGTYDWLLQGRSKKKRRNKKEIIDGLSHEIPKHEVAKSNASQTTKEQSVVKDEAKEEWKKEWLAKHSEKNVTPPQIESNEVAVDMNSNPAKIEVNVEH